MRVRPNQIEPKPLITTRALVILIIAGGAAGLCAMNPSAAVPIGVGLAVVTLLASIVKD
ncbi:hypothetical protein [Spirillospora albida]|uniref:hypothetical protein n=1 Tax=Spirillospora albida TaxID=58123 RepID=UPI0012FA7873|nr:hypothetical protein [Spirillospora albida]